jgi:hypothetical protein
MTAPAMISVFIDGECDGFVLARGVAGFEAFDADERSGLFPSESAAAAAKDLVGLIIKLPEPCPCCKGHAAVIGAGRGPHRASILCACGRRFGWVSKLSGDFLTETIRVFGRPTEPIAISHKPPEGGGVALPSIQT